ncbi:MAG: helix-turn-helix transcriptional regulator [Clostridia bacterium]|nr:helix-turn-helix transcriptional regulator [Clostridia bacterium]
MRFIEIEKAVQMGNWNMKDLHSHAHYEIYYLYKGSRTFLLSNAIYVLDAPVLVVIPPYTMHKTEGGPFERYNIDVSSGYLNDFQRDVLDSIALRRIATSAEHSKELLRLLREMAAIDKKHKKSAHEINALFSYFIYMLSKNEVGGDEVFDENKMSPLVLRIINYFNENFGERITLEDLSRDFFASKTTLIYHFKKYTNCSPIDFLLNVRITKAKEQLVNTKKSVEMIAHDCGFSSANYFGLIFKKKEGMSPANYRKYQRSKF